MFDFNHHKTVRDQIMKSIRAYQTSLLEDINTTLRITYNDETYLTKVTDWIDNRITFAAPLKQLDWIIFPKFIELPLVFVSKSACDIQINASYQKKQNLYYTAKIITPIERKQQREHFRLDVLMDIDFQIIPEGIISPEHIETLPTQKGLSVNISTGGICMTSEVQLLKNQYIYMHFNFLDTPLHLMGKVLFLGEKTNSGTFVHRIQFIGTSPSDTDILNQLIFKKQRLLLRTGKR